MPGKISTNAPKSTMRTTLPRYVLPTSATAAISLTIWMARFAEASSAGEDVHRAVVVDVDLDARHIDDVADHLAARTDQLADLVRRNVIV